MIGWVSLGRHRVHLAYYMSSYFQINTFATLFLIVCSFLAYQGKLWTKTTDNYLILHSWLAFFLLLTKDKFFILFFIDSKLWDCFVFVFTFYSCCSFLKKDFKATLTHGLRALVEYCVPILDLTLYLSLGDLPIMDEEDLVCHKSFSKLYLVRKVLGESVPLKSIYSKIKAKWKTSSEFCFMDLGNDFLIKFPSSKDCTKAWERFYSI